MLADLLHEPRCSSLYVKVRSYETLSELCTGLVYEVITAVTVEEDQSWQLNRLDICVTETQNKWMDLIEKEGRTIALSCYAVC